MRWSLGWLCGLAAPSMALAQHAWRAQFSDVGAPDYGRATLIDLGVDRADPSSPPAVTAPQLPGWPRILPLPDNITPLGSGTIEDLDHDGVPEIIVATNVGKLFVFRADGSDFPGFPLDLVGEGQFAPSVGDLDGDGHLEICLFTRGPFNGGRFYVVESSGAVRSGFPIDLNNDNFEGSPTLADLDDDGKLEIVVPERAAPIGRLHVFRSDGTEWGGNWPVTLSSVPACTTAVADLDGDGELDIVYESYDALYALHRDGTPFAGFPIPNHACKYSNASPALADLDGDGKLEILVAAHGASSNYCAYHVDGTIVAGWPRPVDQWTMVPPIPIDLDGDGQLDVVGGEQGLTGAASKMLYAWNANGVLKPGFPFYSATPPVNEGGCLQTSVVDLDGDGSMEIYSDHDIVYATGLGRIYGVDARGQLLSGFPLLVNGDTAGSTPTFGDVDGDGRTDLLMLSWSFGFSPHPFSVYVNVIPLGTPWHAARMPWPCLHQDVARGGKLGGGRHLFVEGPFTHGGTPTIEVSGAPMSHASVECSLSTSSVQLPFGWWHLGATRSRVIRDVVIPASGAIEQPFHIPNDPSLIGVALYFQGALIAGASGQATNLVERVIQ